MEDRSLAITDLGAPGFSGRALSPQALVAVMDGHGGPGTAEWLRDNLAAEVRAHLGRVAQEVRQLQVYPSTATLLLNFICVAALSAAFATADQKLLLEAQVTSSGSCLTGALVIGARLYVFNVGDSRTLLCRAGALQLATRDHKPDAPAEWDRISEAGGIVLHGRVMGELAVSRAFGDFHLKDPLRLPPEHPRRSPAPLAGGYPQGLTDRWALLQKEAAEGGEEEEPLWQSPLVIPTPEITVAALTDQDEFILLACDGLFDVTTNEEAVEAACSSLRTEGGNDFVAHACETLATRCVVS
ncbi:phosphatase 2C-like domain-containing protein [Tribonema minus]|uniref:Phosphatase 2C-like domain-containing protein n=1 Tax=Tribonema minus TaxID=303371 RepID=A0A835ZI56_9STRA|nr:phosphatase 2C-like domain-containing protein [Tribonema minus]